MDNDDKLYCRMVEGYNNDNKIMIIMNGWMDDDDNDDFGDLKMFLSL